jgi:hypothetical protein
MREKINHEFDEFTKLVDRVLDVPREELERREREYRKQVDQNLNRSGPKRKPKTSADDREPAKRISFRFFNLAGKFSNGVVKYILAQIYSGVRPWPLFYTNR